MPKSIIDYTNTIIYKLCCNDISINDIYVGHTTNFTQRKNQHKRSTNSNNQIRVYQFIREHGGWDNWEMIEIENYSCNNLNEAHKRERYWIETLKAKLNCNNPITTKEEKEEQKKVWYEENKEEILNKKQDNYIKNKEEIIEKNKKYNESHKEEIKYYQQEYNEKNKEKISADKKVYRETHKEEIKQVLKNWREANKDKIKETKTQNVNCDCGNQYTFGNKHRHLQSKIHLKYQNALCGIIEEPKPIISEEEKKEINKIKQKEYREKHAEQIKQYKKTYNDSHKEKNKEQKYNYYHSHKEQIIEQNKKYAEENKEKIKERTQKYYQEKKNKILENIKTKTICECGAVIRQCGISEHYRSMKHKNYLQNNTPENETGNITENENIQIIVS